jgi:hypothetical protein
MTPPIPNPRLSSLFELEYPQSVGVYDSYEHAQKAVDFLADERFAVQNLAIVGTDLRSVERVTGRKNWGTVLLSGVQSGVSTGLMVALILWFVQPTSNLFTILPGALAIGIGIGIVFSALGYTMTRGKRDFNSISQTVASRYEVLCEHKLAAQARELLQRQPGARAAQFDPRNAAYPAGQPPYPQQYGPGSGAPQAGYGQQPPAGAPYPPPSAPPAQPPAEQPWTQRPYGQYGSGEGIGGRPDDTEGGDADGKTPRGDN